MCGVAEAGLALAILSTATSTYAQKEQADAQKNYQEAQSAEYARAAKLNQENANREFVESTTAERIKLDLLEFLVAQKKAGKSVAAYGAAAKGNTLLNCAGVRPDLLPYVVDKNPAKQGQYLPGSRIPIVDEAYLRAHRPDRVLILPWNLRDEVAGQLDYVHGWGGQFAVAVPRLEVF